MVLLSTLGLAFLHLVAPSTLGSLLSQRDLVKRADGEPQESHNSTCAGKCHDTDWITFRHPSSNTTLSLSSWEHWVDQDQTEDKLIQKGFEIMDDEPEGCHWHPVENVEEAIVEYYYDTSIGNGTATVSSNDTLSNNCTVILDQAMPDKEVLDLINSILKTTGWNSGTFIFMIVFYGALTITAIVALLWCLDRCFGNRQRRRNTRMQLVNVGRAIWTTITQWLLWLDHLLLDAILRLIELIQSLCLNRRKRRARGC